MAPKFVQARHYRKGRLKPVRLIVIHSMEMPEKPSTAEGCARFFATTTRPASAHACVDSDSVVLCVRVKDTAFAAPGANADGYHIEHAGYAKQARREWLDPESSATLAQSAVHAAEKARQLKIPARRLTNAQLADGVSRGFVSHHQVSEVFKRSTHTDPGEGFPWPDYLTAVQAEMAALAGKPWKRSRVAAAVAGLGVGAAALLTLVTQIPDRPTPKPTTSTTRPATVTTTTARPRSTATTTRVGTTTRPTIPTRTVTATVTVRRTVTATRTVTSRPRLLVVVRAGDTLYSIAQATRTTIADLRRLNPGVHADNLSVGSLLRVA
jgi:LysM repeat protein